MTCRARRAKRCACIGVVFQPRTLDLDLSVVQNLTYHAALHGIGAGEARSRAERLLGAHRPCRSRARQGARSVRRPDAARRDRPRAAARPRLLLLDEPTVGLDINSRAGILDHVRGPGRRRAVSRALGDPSHRRSRRRRSRDRAASGAAARPRPGAARRRRGRRADIRAAFTRADRESRRTSRARPHA